MPPLAFHSFTQMSIPSAGGPSYAPRKPVRPSTRAMTIGSLPREALGIVRGVVVAAAVETESPTSAQIQATRVTRYEADVRRARMFLLPLRFRLPLPSPRVVVI